MHDAHHSRIPLPDEAATLAFAARLAPLLRPGMVIHLMGDLGAGKTTLVRGLLRALGYTGRVKSPTYTLVESYEAKGLHLRHFDLYRLRSADEWESSGFRDEFNAHNICLVEWPQQAGGLVPPADLELRFEIQAHGRNLELRAYSPAARSCLNALRS